MFIGSVVLIGRMLSHTSWPWGGLSFLQMTWYDENDCDVVELWQNFIDECLVYTDEDVQVGIGFAVLTNRVNLLSSHFVKV